MNKMCLDDHCILDAPSETERSVSSQLGFASQLLSRPRPYFDLPGSYLGATIVSAISRQQIKFYFNDDGDVVGYVVWLLLDDVGERIVRDDPLRLFSVGDWPAGDNLWLVDLVAPHGNLKYIVRDLRKVLLAGRRDFSYFSPKRQRVVTRTRAPQAR